MGNEFRQKFLEENPELSIRIHSVVSSGYGTHKYRCTYSGDWTKQALVDYVDGGTGNFGGRIENEQRNEDGTTTGIVCIYYD